MSGQPVIRVIEFDAATHQQALRDLVVELQDYERALDPRMPSGASIVDEYVPQMFERCDQADGKVLMAESGGEVAGFVTIMTRVSSGELEDGDIEYALIADLIVAPNFRRQGIAQRLLEAAEEFARSTSAPTLRVGVLAANRGALDLYSAHGFDVLFSEMEKDLQP